MLIIVCISVIVIVCDLRINHKIQLKKDAKKTPLLATIINVNNKRLHILTEGKGNITLVFMVDHDTSNPTLDFKPLWS